MPEWTPAAPHKVPKPSPSQPPKREFAMENLQTIFGKIHRLSEIVFLTSWMSNIVKQRARKMSENVRNLAANFLRMKCKAHCRPPSALHSPRSNSAIWDFRALWPSVMPANVLNHPSPCRTLMEPLHNAGQFLQHPLC